MQKAVSEPGAPDNARGAAAAAPGTATASVPGSAPAADAPKPRRRMLRNALIALLGPLLAGGIGGWIYFSGGRYVSTDNAYVKADKIAVSADISGRVVEVAVNADQFVERGQLLFRIDPEPHRITLEKAEAHLAAMLRDAEAMKVLYLQRVARRKQAAGDEDFHAQAHRRQSELGKRGIISQAGMDTADKNLRNARDQIAVIDHEIAEMRAKLGGNPDLPAEAQPGVREARALRDQAALDLARTEVKAAADGTITNFEMQPGEYVTAGKVAFSLVKPDVWVMANFKETDLTHVRAGQPASVHIDTFPDNDRTATVASISQATGAEFALLPPQNATGNWVKVVQRLPVRLKLAPAPGEPPLRAGMSVTVTIDTGHKRQLPRWAQELVGRAYAATGFKP